MNKHEPKIIDLSEKFQIQQDIQENIELREMLDNNMTLDKVNDILHNPTYWDIETMDWFEDEVQCHGISEIDLCYDILTMKPLAFEKKYSPLLWQEMRDYVFHYLKNFKENGEHDEYQDFFERVKRQGEKRKLQSIETLKFNKKWEHIRKCLAKGKDGLRQLADERSEKELDGADAHSFNNFMEFTKMYNQNPIEVLIGAVSMDPYDFHREFEWNWWMCVSEAIFYLALIKVHDNEKFEESLEMISRNMKGHK